MRALLTTCSLILFVLLAPSYAAAQYSFKQELSAIATGIGLPDMRLGAAVAVEGDLSVVSTSSFIGTSKVRTYRLTAGEWRFVATGGLNFSVGNVIQMDLTDGVLAVRTSDFNTGARIAVYRWNPTTSQWGQETSASGNSPQGFLSVASGGNIVVVGDPSHNSNTGRILVLRRDNNNIWQQQFLTPAAPQAAARFGASIAIVSGAILVGAPLEDVTNASAMLIANAGAAYVFTLTGSVWSQVQRIVQPNNLLVSGQSFGEKVAISGADPGTPDRMLIAVNSDDATNEVGRIYRYRFQSNVWTRLADSIAPPSGALDNDGFGCTMHLDGDWAAIGICYKDTVNTTNSGGVLLVNFASNFGSVLSSTLRTDAIGVSGDELGTALALDRAGPTVVAGSPSADLYGNESQGVVLIGRGPTNPAPFLERRIDVGQGLTGAQVGFFAQDADTLLIGAAYESVGIQARRGAVYVYENSGGGYIPRARLLAPDGLAEDVFGTAIAVHGDSALIAAAERSPAGLNTAGAVYAYRRINGQWQFEALLQAPTPASNGRFGWDVDIRGDTALIGARLESYVFVRAANGSWSLNQTIPHGGFQVILTDTLALVADIFGGANNQGKLTTYGRGAGNWQAIGAPLLGQLDNQRFGTSISLSGELLAVGNQRVGQPSALYRRVGSNWQPEANVLPNDMTATTTCTDSAVSNARMALQCVDSVGLALGAVYLFEKRGGTWTQIQKITLSDPRQDDRIGANVAFDANGELLFGSFGRDLEFQNQGAVFRYAEPVMLRDGFED